MELEQVIEAIDKIITNKDYNEILHNYMDDIIKDEYIFSEEDGEIIVSKIGFNEYFSVLIQGPDYVELDFLYHNKDENYKHVLVFRSVENEIHITSEVREGNNLSYKSEEYKYNQLKYSITKDYDCEKKKETIKEIIFNNKNMNFTGIKVNEEGKPEFKLYTVNEVRSPYVFNTSEDFTLYEAKIICEISEKQYIRARKAAIKDVTGVQNKPKGILKLFKK